MSGHSKWSTIKRAKGVTDAKRSAVFTKVAREISVATRGGGEAEQFEEIVYEGYGPGGVAVLVEAATDNRNRTAADVRSLFTKAGGQLAGSGAVAWQFEPRGLIAVTRDAAVD